MTSEALAPEFALTAACCRWPATADRDSAVQATAAGVRDWDEFLRLVRRQRVGGLAHEALSTAKIAPPSAVARVLAARAKRSIGRNLLLAAETVRLQGVLDAAGIATLVLKGVALSQLAYGSPTIKQTRDIDLLVPAERAEAALQILEREGYALRSPAHRLRATQRRALIRFGREVELVRRDGKLPVELEWRASDNPMLLRGVDAHSRAQTVTLPGGGSVRTLALDDLFAYLCVHGARHSWSRLKWLADVNALLAANDADIGALYRHAQRIGAGLCAGQALLLCRQLLALHLPAGLVDELSSDRRVEKLVAIALAAMCAPHADMEADGGIAGVTRYMHTQFLLGRGWSFYATQCRVASIAPVDVVRYPLPPFLQFLYPLLGLPLWLWRRMTAAREAGGRA